MKVEVRDFTGAKQFVDVPVPCAVPGTVLVRTAYSFCWNEQCDLGPTVQFSRLARAAFREPTRALRYIARHLAKRDERRLRLSLVANLGVQSADRRAQTCFSVSGWVEETCGLKRPLRVGTRVAGIGFMSPPHAPFLIVPEDLLVEVPRDDDLTSAALLMPAAMVTYGLEQLVATRRPRRILVPQLDIFGRLALSYSSMHGLPSEVFVRTDKEAAIATRLNASPIHLESDDWRERFSRIDSETAVVLAAPQCDAWLRNGGKALPETGSSLLWIQSCSSLRPTAQPESDRFLAVQIPDPWQEYNLDALSGQELELPAWAARSHLERVCDWLCGGPAGLLDESDCAPIETRKQETICRVHNSGTPVARTIQMSQAARRSSNTCRKVGVSLVGAGDYAPSLMFPLLDDRDVEFRGVADLQPVRAWQAAQLFNFAFCSTTIDPILEDSETGCVFVATDHHSHAEIAARGLEKGKYVYLEKPPAVSWDQLSLLCKAYKTGHGVLQVGYNRPFAPLVARALELLDGIPGPTTVQVTRRPYDVPRNSWYYWRKEGTRMVGNVCHFVDLSYRLTDRALPVSVACNTATTGRADENTLTSVTFADGSIASIAFTRRGSDHEQVVIHRGRRTLLLWDYTWLQAYERGRLLGSWNTGRDFGHANLVTRFVDSCRNKSQDGYPLRDLAITTAIVLTAKEALETGQTIDIDHHRIASLLPMPTDARALQAQLT